MQGRRVAGDGVAVDHHPDQVQDAGGLVAGEASAIRAFYGSAVHVEHVAVRPAKGDAQAALLQAFRHCHGILDRLPLEFLELLGARQLEGQRQGGEDVDVRPALFAGEDGLVNLPG